METDGATLESAGASSVRILLKICISAGILAIVIVVFQSLYLNAPLADMFSMIATIASLVLSVASIVFSYTTNKSTESLLEEIQRNNSTLIERLNIELARDNYNRSNIDDTRTKSWRGEI